MIRKALRAALLSLPLAAWGGLALAGAHAKSAEQDTANGVEPLKETPARGAHAPDAHAQAAPAREPAGRAEPAKEPAAKEADAAAAAPEVAEQPVAAPPAGAPASGSADARRYCDNIAAVAAEARFAWQTRKLTELQGQVAERITELEKKQAALQASLARRDALMKQAAETLVTIYAKMQPDAAAAQLMLLEDATAAAILVQLSPRQSSAILDEIRPERAKDIVGAMTSLPPPPDKTDGSKS